MTRLGEGPGARFDRIPHIKRETGVRHQIQVTILKKKAPVLPCSPAQNIASWRCAAAPRNPGSTNRE